MDEQENEDIKAVTSIICKKINQNPVEIIKAYRHHKRANRPNTHQTPAPIVLTLSEGTREKWLDAAKRTNITKKDLGNAGDNKIYLRERLSPSTSFLLWKSKKELKDSELYKFVWCKNGTILARKTETDKTQTIRSIKDLEKLTAHK